MGERISSLTLIHRMLWIFLFAGLALLAPAGAAGAEQNTLSLSIEEAVLLALEHSTSLKLQRLVPSIRKTYEREAQGSLDPRLTAGISQSWDQTGHFAGPGADSGASAGVSLSFPSGTSMSGTVATTWGDQRSTSYDLQVTQSILQGGGVPVNLARIRQARIDTFSSLHELEGFTAALVADVESSYWEHYLAQRQLEIYRESLGLAQRQLEETRVRIRVGKIAEIELAAAQAELASRQEALLGGETRAEATRLRLILIVNPPGSDWETKILILDRPSPPEGPLDDVRSHVEVGLLRRPDLNQAKLELQREQLELVWTRNGILPRLDLFLRLGKTGYADSFSASLGELAGEPSVSAGINFEYPLGNREAEAQNQRARLGRMQAEEAVRTLQRLIEADIRSAYFQVSYAAQRVEGTSVLRALQEEKLRAETEKFRVGSSTTFLVAQAQRDLLSSQLAEVQASVAYLQALLSLYRLEGSLLERRGVAVPEPEPGSSR